MNAIERMQQEYLAQCGLDYTPENVAEAGLDPACLHVLYEDTKVWIILHKEEWPSLTDYSIRLVLNVVYKDEEKEMESIEI